MFVAGDESPRSSQNLKAHFRRKKFQSPQLRARLESILQPPPSSLVEDLLWVNINTVESRKYAPLFCMLASGKAGEGAYAWDHDISAWRPLPTNDCRVDAISVLLLVVWWRKQRKTLIWHIHVAMDFKGLSIHIARFHSLEGGGLIRGLETKYL